MTPIEWTAESACYHENPKTFTGALNWYAYASWVDSDTSHGKDHVSIYKGESG